MIMKKNIGIGTFLLAMLLIFTVFVSTVNAQENLKISDKPSQVEQGLIDALNSNSKNLHTDDVIANYCKANKDKISESNLVPKNTISNKNNLRTYKLEDGSNITFTNEGYFYITGAEEEANDKTVTKSTTEVISSVPLQYTSTKTASASFYDIYGLRLFSIYAKGYYGYNVYPATVKAYYIDSWYTRGTASIWQVSNWKEGGYNYANTPKSEIYGKGNFHWGFEYNGVGVIIQDKYITVKSTCDQFGNVHCTYEVV
ncbi:hypothetical protein [Methanosarcina sp. UBA289]|uniref:hypothetical protein n=1 Tax=Methanosarcina sp. UBA289 TaxID=1915574 RepID=UPI0025DCCE3F|nr:hypothetical protein [Methanosarcina sp. UBA289]